MEAREEVRDIVNQWHIRHYEEPLKDPRYIEGAMYQALIDSLAEALLLREKEAWNQAVEACEKVALEWSDEKYNFGGIAGKISNKIKELRRP